LPMVEGNVILFPNVATFEFLLPILSILFYILTIRKCFKQTLLYQVA